MNNEEQIRRIEAYLDGEMSETEGLAFERELALNPELKDELDFHQDIRDAMSDKDIIQLRKTLSNIRDNNASKKKRNIRWSVAAVITGVVVAGSALTTFYFSGKSNNDEEIFKKYYKQVDAGIIQRSVNDTAISVLNDAIKFYETKNFKKAIDLLNSIPDTSENKVVRDYFSGLSSMGLEKYTQAIKYFDSVAQSQELLYAEDAIWQSGLCYLKLNDRPSAKQEFKKLENASPYYQKKVSELMEYMD